MKALSIRQPWAWAIMHAGKRHENRSRRFHYRGPLLIHASKDTPKEEWWDARNYYEIHRGLAVEFGELERPVMPMRDAMSFGGIVGIVDVIDCVSESNSPWFFGPHALVLANPRPVEFVPFKGKLGLFDVPDELVKVL